MSDPMTLKRLLYLGDVPVESSYHGSALIYRLLQNYPPEKLRVVEGNLRNSLPERRLTGVRYASTKIGWRRPLYTRFSRWAHLAYSLAARWKVGSVEQSLDDFHPEAVLTVAHDFLWLAAARYARKHSLPLHLICHDDWPRLASVPPVFRAGLEQEFKSIYRQAASRLCVSPYMVEEYERRYGVKGTVLYPSRSADAACFDAPPERLMNNHLPLTVAFAGTINSAGYVRALQSLARCLEKIHGQLLLFGPLKETDAARAGLKQSNIKLCGMLSSADLIKRLRIDADVLFIPMSFSPDEREYSALSFPSKLTDYTAAGLPLLIYGPDYCSAARWARENSGVAEAVTEESVAALDNALKKLVQAEHRMALAKLALQKGREFFSYNTGWNIFCSAFTGNLFHTSSSEMASDQ
ncbi:MAG TPA: glycosyltransferase [Verrucomicrobiae bacterium]|nr:glycosyltransferase [Verrucomicrobiae bacterium]